MDNMYTASNNSINRAKCSPCYKYCTTCIFVHVMHTTNHSFVHFIESYPHNEQTTPVKTTITTCQISNINSFICLTFPNITRLTVTYLSRYIQVKCNLHFPTYLD